MFVHVALQQMPEKLQQLSQILKLASELIIKEYTIYCQGKEFKIQEKADLSPVTQADLNSHHYISELLIHHFGDIPILSEEGQHQGRQCWDYFWLLDPLDGTKEFIHQTDEFSINLSLMYKDSPVISAIALPMKQTLYINQEKQPPFRYQWRDAQVEVAHYHICPKAIPKTWRIAMSRRPERNPYYRAFQQFLQQQQIAFEIITAGSAYKFCLMLEEQIDMYPRFHPTSEWDTAAGQGLLQGIGGDVLSLKQHSFRYNVRDSLINQNFIALRNRDDWQVIEQFVLAIHDQD